MTGERITAAWLSRQSLKRKGAARDDEFPRRPGAESLMPMKDSTMSSVRGARQPVNPSPWCRDGGVRVLERLSDGALLVVIRSETKKGETRRVCRVARI